jgi:hypothetical protein
MNLIHLLAAAILLGILYLINRKFGIVIFPGCGVFTLFKGGISKVEFNTTDLWGGTQTEILGIMKETKVEPSTPTEELASGQAAAAGKELKFTIVTNDLDSTKIATLQGYETAQTPIFFRFSGINTVQKLVLKSVIPIIDLKPAESGKFWTRVISGKGFADSEANLIGLTLS